MPLPPGARIGAYEVVAALGAGGMGEVYRARDSKLGREVALKILPEEFAADPERLARFEREARTLASLNHPHIAQIYGFEQAGESSALVMELVEGEDLAERLTRGPIPLDEALPIARQIAEALEAAHEAGIIHRDLKPANVKVRPDGTVKVLDFGLAKALEPGSGLGAPGSADLVNSPTITTPAMTMQGMILGTAAYMAPEQAKGKAVDRRADIWAFGCVLYEMLTGTRTFAGEDISDTLVSILRDDPRWAALPPDTPPHVRALLRRCLQKDPQKRLPHIGAARLDLSEGVPVEPTTEVRPRSSGRIAASAAGALLGAAVVAAAAFVMRPTVEPATPPMAVQFEIEPPAAAVFPGANLVPRFAVSPDGRHVVFQAQDNKAAQLWMRTLDTLDERPIPGTQTALGGAAAQQTFWSPDGRSLGFFDELARELKRMDWQGGPLQTLAEIGGNQFGGSWNDSNVILMSSTGTAGVRSVAASGGAVAQVTTVDKSQHEVSHLWPEFLWDGRHFIYLATYEDDKPPALLIASLEGGPAKRLFDSPAGARPAWPDRLLFVRDNALLSQRFDLDRLELVGEPTVVVSAASHTAAGRLGASVSHTGVLVHSVGATGSDSNDTVWLDRHGQEIQPSPPRVSVGASGVRLSPDGSRLIYGRTLGYRRGRLVNELWIQDTVRGIESRLTTDAAAPGMPPVFSRDGNRVVFRRADAPLGLQEQTVSGAAPGKPIIPMEPGRIVIPYDWTPDGRLLVFRAGINSNSGPDQGLWLVPSAIGQPLMPYLPGVQVSLGAAFSPDGRWVAYTSGLYGIDRQVFIQPFPDASAGKWPVSAAGGAYPRWRRDGRELFFVDPYGMMMAVDVSVSPRLEIGAPKKLFQLANATGYSYDVSPDGQHVVTTRPKFIANEQVKLIVTVGGLRAGEPR